MHACRPTTVCVHLCNSSKNEKKKNQALAETTSIENQNPLKTQKLTLIEKKKNIQGKFHRTKII
jgi:hypothetical protein